MLYKIYAQLRDDRKLSDYQVAKATGIATATFSNWKAGTYTPKLDKIKKLADYFGVSIEAFLEDP